MTEIPEHLMKRLKEFRSNAKIESDGSDDSHLPSHLRERITAKRQESSGDPFAHRKEVAADTAAKLLGAKQALLVAVSPLKDSLKDASAALKGQFVKSDGLSLGASFTPRTAQADIKAYLTLYRNRERFDTLEGGKTLRVGEQTAWRMPVAKNELSSVLREAGQRPIRDTWNLVEDGFLFVAPESINTSLAELVFEKSAAERVTNSVALYDGVPTPEGYSASYGNRYAASLSVTRNPASLAEVEGSFGVDLLSLDGSYRTDEGRTNDGSLLEGERVVLGGVSLFSTDRKPSDDGFANVFTSTGLVLTAFGGLLSDPSAENETNVYQSLDRYFQ